MVKNILSLSKLMVLIFVAVLVFGTFSILNIPKESSPDVQLPTISISVTNRGMSPEDVETLITRPIEREVIKINGIDEMISRSFEGRSFVRISFQSGLDIKELLDEVRDKVDIAESDFPGDADDPIISETNVALFPIISIGFAGNDISYLELLNEVKIIEEKLERIQGVFEVDVVGDLTEIVTINIPRRNIYGLNLSPRDISNTIIENNTSLSGGSAYMEGDRESFSLSGLAKTLNDIESIPVFSNGRSIVSIGNIGEVLKDVRDPSSSSFIDNKRSVTLEVSKDLGVSSLTVADAVKNVIENNRGTLEDKGVSIYYMEDSSEDVRNMLNSLTNTVILTMLVVAIVIYFFLGLKSSISLVITIPVSFLVTFIFLYLLGYTVNNVALFGLILVTGMLVDSAIVVSDYADKLKQDGYKTKQAYINSSIRMSKPIIISVLTTVFAFLPVLFWPGTIGDFMMYIPLTVIVTLLSSLFVSLFLLPTIAGIFSFKSQVVYKRKSLIIKCYKKLLIRSIRHPIYVIGITLIAVISMGAFYYYNNNGFEFFPDGDSDFISVNVFKEGSHSLENMESEVNQIAEYLLGTEGVKLISSRVRESDFSDSIGQIQLQLDDWRERERSSDIISNIRNTLDSNIADNIRYTVSQRSRGPGGGGGGDFMLEANSTNIEELNRFIDDTMIQLDKLDVGMVSIDTERKNGGDEIAINIDKSKAKAMGVSQRDVADFISLMTIGVRAGSITLSNMNDSLDMYVMLPRHERTLENVMSMNIIGSNGVVPIRALANIENQEKVSVIRRTDGQRTMIITADFVDGINVFDVIDDINELMVEQSEKFPSVNFSIRGQVEDAQETSYFMIIAFLTSIVLMLSALLYQFNSYLKSLLVFVAVVFSTIGVFFIVSILGQPFGIVFSGLAILSLAGISINHNIILIDEYLHFRNKGYSNKVSSLYAATSRFKPIMLTVMTTSIGLSPMIFKISIDFFEMELVFGDPAMDMWSQMASNIAGGLLISALISLIFTPTILSYMSEEEKE